MDQEIKELIDEYVKKIEDKEEVLLAFKHNVDKILFDSKEELKHKTEELDVKFDANNISEEEYLSLFRMAKESVLKETREKLNYLTQNLENI